MGSPENHSGGLTLGSGSCVTAGGAFTRKDSSWTWLVSLQSSSANKWACVESIFPEKLLLKASNNDTFTPNAGGHADKENATAKTRKL